MSYCKRMKRDCVCGKLSIYDRNGNVREVDSGVGCLTDTEVQSALTVLLQEWQNCFGGARAGACNEQIQLQ